MSMALTLRKYLADQGVAYDVVSHPHTASSMDTAVAAHIPAESVAKSVIVEDESGYLMAVIPANHHLKIGRLNNLLQRRMGLATESELEQLFSDCALGAIPAVGQAYGIQTVVDDSLRDCHDIYFEAGNHEELIHMRGTSFRRLMKNSQHAVIS